MSKLNPQKASAYVGPGVLRKGGKITPVPNGPLVKKKGPYKGSTLKAGGTIKKAASGLTTTRETTIDPKLKITRDSIKNEQRKIIWKKSYETSDAKKKGQDFDTWYKDFDTKTKENSKKAPEPRGEKTFFAGDNGPKSPCKGGKCSGLNKNGGSIKKAKAGTKVKKAMVGAIMSMAGGKDNPIYKKTTDLRGKLGSAALGMPGMKPIVKNGKMIKRADGSMSKRGLWDNLRSKAAQNKKTGAKPKAPTRAMLTQEKKIKAKK